MVPGQVQGLSRMPPDFPEAGTEGQLYWEGLWRTLGSEGRRKNAECRMIRQSHAKPPWGQSEGRRKNGEWRGKATQSQLKATSKPSTWEGIATQKPPTSHLNATLKPPACDLKATPEPPCRGTSRQDLRVFGFPPRAKLPSPPSPLVCSTADKSTSFTSPLRRRVRHNTSRAQLHLLTA